MLTQIQKPQLGAQINWEHPLAKGLVGCWLMNEGSGNKIYDLSGNGNTATITGDAAMGVGPYGSNLACGGTNGYASAPVSPDLSAGYTFMTLCRRSSAAAAALRVMTLADPAIALYPVLGIDGIGYSNEIIFSIAPQPSNSIGTGEQTFGLWNQIICVGNGRLSVPIAMHVNGKKFTAPPNIALAIDTHTGVKIGTRGNLSTYLAGDIAYAMHWNRALTDQEAAQLYTTPYAMFEQDTVWGKYVLTASGLSIPVAMHQNFMRQ